jgi:hypothetical protein
MKLGCDGSNPCKTCRHKKIECKFSRLESKGLVIRKDGRSIAGGNYQATSDPTRHLAPKIGSDNHLSSDRGSINFLLNSGTASFIECFRLPSSHERRNLFNFRNIQKASDSVVDPLELFGSSSDNGSNFSEFFEDESIDWSLFEEENLLRFLSSPFNDSQAFGPTPPIVDISFPVEWEPPSLQSSAIVQCVMNRAMLMHIDHHEQSNISQNLNYLFTPSKIDKFISLYFEFWHPHCPILHQESFNIQTAPIPLVTAVTMMGAMYSQVDREVNTAKLLLDLVEFYIFSLDDLTDEYEIRQVLRIPPISIPDSITLSTIAFQNLQAAYVMICVQFWAGNMVSRKRAADTRFAVAVKVGGLIALYFLSAQC